MGEVRPVPGDEVAALLAALALVPGDGALGLAVSGGGDSVALLRLMAEIAPPAQLAVVTVDHGLRAAAADEAAFVARLCADLGLRHRVLRWEERPERGNLMQNAAQARYALMAEWARAEAVSRVLLAHTADDQAETFLMGLSRAAGLDGLSGMRPEFELDGVVFSRPLLGVTRAALREALHARGQGWCEDPSNADPRFARVRARGVMPALAHAGIGPEAMAESIRHLAAVQDLARWAMLRAWEAIGREIAGVLHLDAMGFAESHAEIRRRLLIAAIAWIGGGRHAPRAEALARLEAGLMAGEAMTLAGCAFRPAHGEIRILREVRAAGEAVPHGEVWDHRWRIEGPAEPGDRIAALGGNGLAACPAWRETGIARDALLVSPALWREERLIAAPLAGYGAEKWRVTTPQGFAYFAQTH